MGTGVNLAGTHTPLVTIRDPIFPLVPSPITAAPSASQDHQGRLWLYFGTGQFYHENDKASNDKQYLVGVKEPVDWYNCTGLGDPTQLTISCNAGLCNAAVTVPQTNLLDVTKYKVFEGGLIDRPPLDFLYSEPPDITFDNLVIDIRQYGGEPDVPKHWDGWILDINNGERCVSKPTILGGIATFTSFKPDDDACAFEGESRLYALYYTTGTAFYEPIIGYGDDTIGTVGGDVFREINRSISLGAGVAATPSLHVGEEEGVKAFVQSSTGEIEIIDEINLPEAYKSKPLFWIQESD